MPELPEIALIKDYVDATALDKEIKKISFLHTGALQAPEKDFEKALQGRKFTSADRLGKYLFLNTDKDTSLVFHFGMTGDLSFYTNQEMPKYTRLLLEFKNGDHLAYTCRRKLGKIFLTRGMEQFQEEHSLGPDALDLKEKDFMKLLERKSGSIKGVLTDQHLLSGIGNVYSDEILYQCNIHPKSRTNTLSDTEKKALFNQMRRILKMAVELGGERSEFPEDFLIRHRKEGVDCPKCPGKIEKIKVSGRSTYFCSTCQELKA